MHGLTDQGAGCVDGLTPHCEDRPFRQAHMHRGDLDEWQVITGGWKMARKSKWKRAAEVATARRSRQLMQEFEQGAAYRIKDVATKFGISYEGARVLVHQLSGLIPIVRGEDGYWRQPTKEEHHV